MADRGMRLLKFGAADDGMRAHLTVGRSPQQVDAGAGGVHRGQQDDDAGRQQRT